MITWDDRAYPWPSTIGEEVYRAVSCFLNRLKDLEELIVTPNPLLPSATSMAACGSVLEVMLRGAQAEKALFPRLKRLRMVQLEFDPSLLPRLILSRHGMFLHPASDTYPETRSRRDRLQAVKRPGASSQRVIPVDSPSRLVCVRYAIDVQASF
ncbi:hypothetical protein BDV98DRAFT_284427 [Pterulicium gracile]|uniref:Uncharacterized protein n=1 Tax=Pterulicium gracile TaxID=1884261 RepID=A0A5C3QXK0_9AGAR|nr:hypothetical protein BDV98DRAFT_284427 [Pterula gracilis]